ALPEVEFTLASQSVGEGDGTATVEIKLNTVSGQDVVVPWSMSGTATGAGIDYNFLPASPITITAGNTAASIIVSLTNDSMDEFDETIIFTLGSPTNATEAGN